MKKNIASTMILMGFVPEGIEIPASAGGFTRIQPGENRLRIVSKTFPMWQTWENKKKKNHPFNGLDSKPPKPTSTKDDSVSFVLAFAVYNYTTEKIEVYECDKISVLRKIENLDQDKDWGDVTTYDIKVIKTGSGQQGTKYDAVPCPKAEPSPEVQAAYDEADIYLENLLIEGKSPFGDDAATEAKTTAAKVVTPENWVDGDPVPAGYKQTGTVLTKAKKPFGAA